MSCDTDDVNVFLMGRNTEYFDERITDVADMKHWQNEDLNST